jgi:hypothetical protein
MNKEKIETLCVYVRSNKQVGEFMRGVTVQTLSPLCYNFRIAICAFQILGAVINL